MGNSNCTKLLIGWEKSDCDFVLRDIKNVGIAFVRKHVDPVEYSTHLSFDFYFKRNDYDIKEPFARAYFSEVKDAMEYINRYFLNNGFSFVPEHLTILI